MKDVFAYVREIGNLDRFDNEIITGLIIADDIHSSSNLDWSEEEIISAVRRIHGRGLKAIVKVDRLFAEGEMADLQKYLCFLDDIETDAVIYTDLGIKILIERNCLKLKGIYAPETLLTDYYDIKSLQKDGVAGCVISKDIPLKDVYEIIEKCPHYCYLRIHGPILIAYSRRRYIKAYLQQDGDYSRDYYLQEESRENRLPLIEKETGSWLYDAVLQSYSEITKLYETELNGVIIDNIMHSDEYTLKVIDLYSQVIKGNCSAENALQKLYTYDETIRYTDINEVRETWLDKEK